MTIADLYKKLKQILADSNIALANRGLEQVNSLMEIPERLETGGGRLALLVSKEITEITAEDLEGVTEIPHHAFRDCVNLTSVIIPSSVTRIYSSAFDGCNHLTIYMYPTTPPVIGSNSIPIGT